MNSIFKNPHRGKSAQCNTRKLNNDKSGQSLVDVTLRSDSEEQVANQASEGIHSN